MEKNTPSDIVLTSRRALSVSGVRAVEGYDDMQLEAETEQGLLFVRGRGLRIASFDSEKGTLEVEGTVDGLIYGEQKEKPSLFSRLFR